MPFWDQMTSRTNFNKTKSTWNQVSIFHLCIVSCANTTYKIRRLRLRFTGNCPVALSMSPVWNIARAFGTINRLQGVPNSIEAIHQSWSSQYHETTTKSQRFEPDKQWNMSRTSRFPRPHTSQSVFPARTSSITFDLRCPFIRTSCLLRLLVSFRGAYPANLLFLVQQYQIVKSRSKGLHLVGSNRPKKPRMDYPAWNMKQKSVSKLTSKFTKPQVRC